MSKKIATYSLAKAVYTYSDEKGIGDYFYKGNTEIGYVKCKDIESALIAVSEKFGLDADDFTEQEDGYWHLTRIEDSRHPDNRITPKTSTDYDLILTMYRKDKSYWPKKGDTVRFGEDIFTLLEKPKKTYYNDQTNAIGGLVKDKGCIEYDAIWINPKSKEDWKIAHDIIDINKE